MCKKSIMDPIPHNQYRPICVSAHPVMVPQTLPLRRRFNFMKADWNGYSVEFDKYIEDIQPIPANYKCFVESVRVPSRRHIIRGCRTGYVPGLTDKSKSLYKAYKCKDSSSPFDDGTIESGNTLIDKMTEEKGRDGRKSSRPPILLTIVVKRGRRLESCLITIPHPILHV